VGQAGAGTCSVIDDLVRDWARHYLRAAASIFNDAGAFAGLSAAKFTHVRARSLRALCAKPVSHHVVVTLTVR